MDEEGETTGLDAGRDSNLIRVDSGCKIGSYLDLEKDLFKWQRQLVSISVPQTA